MDHEPMAPACMPCKERVGTCFPGPCKWYHSQPARSVRAPEPPIPLIDPAPLLDALRRARTLLAQAAIETGLRGGDAGAIDAWLAEADGVLGDGIRKEIIGG